MQAPNMQGGRGSSPRGGTVQRRRPPSGRSSTCCWSWIRPSHAPAPTSRTPLTGAPSPLMLEHCQQM